MQILIDNKDLKTVYGIECLDYTGALSFARERENEREWQDKSGLDRNLANIKFDTKEFVLSCIVKDTTEVSAYNKVKTLVDYIYSKGCFVLSLRDSARSIRECYICERSGTIVGDINVRAQNGLYYFKLGLKDINPNALKFQTSIVGLETTILYTKGQTAVLYWGDGSIDQVSNSGNYTKSDYAANGLVDVIVDIDKDAETVEALIADFSADVTSGIKSQTVNFTDTSTGTVEIWSWNFGDGNTSSLQNPTNIYTTAGIYTVTLQVFNSAKGSDVETKVGYITIRNARLMLNDTDFILVNNTDFLLKN